LGRISRRFLYNRCNADHVGASDVTVKNISNTHKTHKGFVGASYLNSSTAKHSGNSVLTLINVTKTSGNILGGSVLGAAGCNHTGHSKLVIKYAGTYGTDSGAAVIVGGSWFNTNNVTHSGGSTLEIWGSIADENGVYPSTLAFYSYVQGASATNSKIGVHDGDTYLILRDLNNDNSTKADNFTSTNRFYGGSVMSYTGDATAISEIKGNTTVILRRCEMPYIIFGGSYLDGNNVQSGNSKIILEGNIALNADGTESEGTGYNIIRSQIRGGSNVAGWISNSVIGKPAHTGTTGVDIIAGPYAGNSAPITHKTVLYTRVYGGNEYNARVTDQQTTDATITFVKGTVNYGGTPEIIPGPIYNGQVARTSTATAENMPTFKTVINQGAYFGGALYAGGYIDYNTNTNYYNHSAIIINGGAGTKFVVGHKIADSSRHATHVGNSVFEIGASGYTGSNATVSAADINTTRAEGYKAYIKFLDAPTNVSSWTVSGFDVLDLYRSTGDVSTITAKVTATTTFNPFVDGVTVTLSNKNIANGTKFADFMKGQTVTIGTDTYAYDELTAVDAITQADNAFDFYTYQFGEEQKIDTLDVINKVKVGEGADRSAEITLTNTSRDTGIHGHVGGLSLSLGDNIGINMVLNNTITNTYTDIKLKVVFNGEEYLFEEPTKVSSTTMTYSFTNVGPHMMGDTARFMFYAKNANGDEVSSGILPYSVKKYAVDQMDSTDAAITDEFKTVCMDLLNYGAKAQVYAEYKTDAIVTDGLESYQQYASTTEAVPEDCALVERIDAPVVATKGPSLALGNNVSLRYKYQITGNLEDYYAKVVIGGDTELIIPGTEFRAATEQDTYFVVVNQLNPAQMRDEVKVTIMSGETQVSHTVTYSISSYVYSMGTETGALADAVKAMLTYGYAVEAWLA